MRGKKAYPQVQAEETPLSIWRRETGVTRYWVCQQLSCSWGSVVAWESGQALPSLVYAFRIEAITKGAIPASAWLTTTLGQHLMNDMTSKSNDPSSRNARLKSWRTRKLQKILDLVAIGRVTEQEAIEMRRAIHSHQNRPSTMSKAQVTALLNSRAAAQLPPDVPCNLPAPTVSDVIS